MMMIMTTTMTISPKWAGKLTIRPLNSNSWPLPSVDDLKDVRNILALTTSGKVPHLEADPLEMYAFELRPYALYKNKYQKKNK